MLDQCKIRIRVGAVIISDKRVLLIEHVKDDKKYWLVPGGGVKFGENLSEALKRELNEELAIDIEINDLIFSSDSISKKDNRHIVNLYFECAHVSGELKLGHDRRLNSYGYFSAEELSALTIIPPIKKELVSILNEKNSLLRRYAGSRWDEI